MAPTSMHLPSAGTATRSLPPPRAQSSRWAWSIGHLFGIEVRVHATFLILLGWVAMTHLMAGHGVGVAASGVGYVMTVFAIIVLHELGHALIARRFGIATRDITLLPIGGIARLERMPSRPSEELLVAIAGPAVNVALAALLLCAVFATGALGDVTRPTFVGGPFLVKIMWTNVAIGAFNLIPAFPMDGGRVLRAVLAMRTSYVRATDIAARVGQGLALVFGLVGLFLNPFLVFIALFVWIGAQAEARMAHVHAALSDLPVTRAMVTRFAVVSPTDPVSDVVQLMLTGFQDDVPVVEGSRLVGVLGKEEVLKAALDGRAGALVATLMRRDAASVGESEPLEIGFERLQASGRRSIPVVRGDALVGVLPIDNIAYVLQEASARCLALARGAASPP